jgi:predicted nucleic acid-binding protein
LCLLTRMAVLRLLTNRVAMNGSPVAPQVALDAWRELATDPRTFFLDAIPVAHERSFASLVAGREPTPNLWSDAWLAALAQSLDHEIVTFDRGFKSFSGIRLRLLSVEKE